MRRADHVRTSSPPARIVKRYRAGESGDQGSGSGMSTRFQAPVVPAARRRPPSGRSTSTSRGPRPAPSTPTRRRNPVRSGSDRMSTTSIAVRGSGSIHTLPQMPEVAVYQMVRGFRDCLPRWMSRVSVGSATSRRSSTASRSVSATSTWKGR